MFICLFWISSFNVQWILYCITFEFLKALILCAFYKPCKVNIFVYFRPDDIHTLYSGKTVEINNTDAEGRLVLGKNHHYYEKFGSL